MPDDKPPPAYDKWEDALAAAGTFLADKKKPPAARLDAACSVLVRSLPAEKVRPREAEKLSLPRPDDDARGPGEDFLGWLFGLRADGVQGAGFVSILLADGGYQTYRVLKHKAADDGGNDFALIERHTPAIEV